MLRGTLALLVMSLSAGMGHAGAWPREKGSGFASVSVRLGWPQNLEEWASSDPTSEYRTAYLEYGLTDRFMIGIDFGNSVSGDTKAIAFLQYPLRDQDEGPKIAVQFGFGEISKERVVRPGLAAGWGLEKGWFSIESFMELRSDSGKADYKVDLTWGRNLAMDRKFIVQLQTGVPDGDPPFARIAPSVVFPITQHYMLETGATWGVHSDSSMGMKVELWAEF